MNAYERDTRNRRLRSAGIATFQLALVVVLFWALVKLVLR